MNEPEFLALLPVTCSRCGKKSLVLVTRCDGFGFAFPRLKNWHKIVNPIKKHNNDNYCNLVITFNSHLDTVLYDLHVFPPLQGWFSALLLSLNQSQIIYDKCNNIITRPFCSSAFSQKMALGTYVVMYYFLELSHYTLSKFFL